jgi:osmotically-inducible protein OsmY
VSHGKSKRPDRKNQQLIAEPGKNLATDHDAVGRDGDAYRREMQGQGTGGYGGQYAGMAAGVREDNGRLVPQQPSAFGTFDGEGGARSASTADLARDVEVQAAIIQEIERCLGPESRQIQCKVVRGEAFLEGRVATAAVGQQAADIATRLGASRVVNNLRIGIG